MKKNILIFVFFSLAVMSIFAQEFSITSGYGLQSNLGVPVQDVSDGFNFGYGLYSFVDYTYFKVDATAIYNLNMVNNDFSYFAFNLALSGKYPFAIKDFVLFPILGARLVLPAWSVGFSGFEAPKMVFMGLQTGVGVDYPLNARFFLRSELLFNIDFKGFGEFFDDADNTQRIGPVVKIGFGYRLDNLFKRFPFRKRNELS